MTARSIVDHCAHPWDLTNDIGTNESAHLEIISQSGIPNGEIIAATQPRSICYAPCYAMRLMNDFWVHFAIQKPVRITLIIWQKMNLWPLLAVCRACKCFWVGCELEQFHLHYLLPKILLRYCNHFFLYCAFKSKLSARLMTDNFIFKKKYIFWIYILTNLTTWCIIS